jgi:hypothetical protein
MNDTIVITNLAMKEKCIDITFTCDLHTIQVWVSGNYHVGLNAFNPTEINNQDLDEFATDNDFDEYELRSALQEVFENR